MEKEETPCVCRHQNDTNKKEKKVSNNIHYLEKGKYFYRKNIFRYYFSSVSFSFLTSKLISGKKTIKFPTDLEIASKYKDF